MELYRATARCRLRVPAVCRWQMAMASASEASIGSGGTERPRSRVTMCCTCCFSARPYPTTDDLMVSGEYSATSSPAAAAASIATVNPDRTIDFRFHEVEEKDVPPGVVTRFSQGFVHQCF